MQTAKTIGKVIIAGFLLFALWIAFVTAIEGGRDAEVSGRVCLVLLTAAALYFGWRISAATESLAGSLKRYVQIIDKDEFVFRRTKWGMSFDEVKRSESRQKDSRLTGKWESHKLCLEYEITTYNGFFFGTKIVAGEKLSLKYFFTADKLDSIIVYVGHIPYRDEKYNAIHATVSEKITSLKDAINTKYNHTPEENNLIIPPSYLWRLKNKTIHLYLEHGDFTQYGEDDDSLQISYYPPNDKRLEIETKGVKQSHIRNDESIRGLL